MTNSSEIFTARCAGRASLKGVDYEPFHIVAGNKTLCGRDASDWLRMDEPKPTDDPRMMAMYRDCCKRCRAKVLA